MKYMMEHFILLLYVVIFLSPGERRVALLVTP